MTDQHEQNATDAPIITTIQWSKAARYVAAVLFLFALVALLVFTVDYPLSSQLDYTAGGRLRMPTQVGPVIQRSELHHPF